MWIYCSLNIDKLRYKLNMKGRLTFNSAELTGHTIIVVIFLESMQETVQVKIKSSTLVKLFERYHFSKSKHLEVSRYAFKIDHFWHTGKLLKTKNAIEIFLNTYQLICPLSENAIKEYFYGPF